MSTNFLIGIFDSGIGGLSVLSEIRKQLPRENFVYIADSAFTPYGEKTEKDITERCFQLVDSLIAQGATAIVVACNTATAIAVNQLRSEYSLPIIAMEPGVKPAVEKSKQGRVGILATTMTLSSHRYAHLLERFATGAEVYEQPCPGLVECVEKMQTDTLETENLLHQYLDPMMKKQVDTLVLGCTHYPYLRKQIEAICGPAVRVIDTAAAVTRELKRRLESDSKIRSTGNGNNSFMTTGSKQNFQKQLDFFWPEQATAQSLKLAGSAKQSE